MASVRKRLFPGVLILLGVVSCTGTPLAPIGREGSFRPEEDERRIWNRAAEEQKKLDESGHLHEDQGLVGYVNQVARRVVPEGAKGKVSFRIRVMKNPLSNAFALPHGVIYIHTGILAKMENEAQLATLLAHEITHVTHRHAIQEYRGVQSTTAVLATVQAASAPFGPFGGMASLLGTIGAMAAVSGYSKSFEREADREGLDLMARAGYDPEEAPKLFEHIQRELEQEKIKEPFFFGTHPRLEERKESYAQLLRGQYAGKKGEKGTERFMERIQPLLLENARLDLSMGRFSLAQEGVERFLKKRPKSAQAHYYLGEVLRQRGDAGDQDRAEKEYRQAAQYDPAYPESYKGLGLVYYKQGKKEKARAELKRYLSLAPQAKDRGYIEQYLQQIER